MKWLIVNADDYGFSPGVTRGILEAHRHGVVTSASLLVDTEASEEAAREARRVPALSLGLHADLPPALARGEDPAAAAAELERQLERFEALVGRPPTHLDSHHNVHRHPALAPLFLAAARRRRLPLREHSAARYFPHFYGQWGGRSHPEHLALPSLVRMLEERLGPGLTELACHPGHPDRPSGYFAERAWELRTLCDPALRGHLSRLGFSLVSYHDYPRLTA